MGLFGPAWKSNNEYIACSVVKRITDQDKLAQIVKESESRLVRLTALENLTDQTVLAEVARKDSDRQVYRAAVKNLTDQTLLAEIALKDSNYSVREAAVEKLTDQKALAEIAILDSYGYVRHVAVKNLTDQTWLAEVAKRGEKDVSEAATKKLTDNDLLIEIAGKSKNIISRVLAYKKLNVITSELEELLLSVFKEGHREKYSIIIEYTKSHPSEVKPLWKMISTEFLSFSSHTDYSDWNGYDDNGTGRSYAHHTDVHREVPVFPPYPFED
jgi:hypothetical protein